MESRKPAAAAAAAASMQDFDGASDCSSFSIITPPSPSVSSYSKCSSHDKSHENGSNVAPADSDQEPTLKEKRLPAEPTKLGLEAPEPCIHSLTEQSEYLRSKLAEVEAALERFQKPSTSKSANANARTARDDSRTMTSERQTDDQKQTVASLQDECLQLWEKVNRVPRQHWLGDKHGRSSDANDTTSSRNPREDPLPPTLSTSAPPHLRFVSENLSPRSLTPSELKAESLDPADRKWCLELLKVVTSIMEPDATLASTTAPAPAPSSAAEDGITGPPPSEGKKKKKKKGESKPKAALETPLGFPLDLDQFGMSLVEQPPELPPVGQPMDPFEAFFATQPPKKWVSITEIDVRWWIRTVFLVCQILCIIGVIILVFKAPGLLGELLHVMHPRNRDRCIGFRVRR